MPALLNANADIRCAHGGAFEVAVRGPRAEVGGAPALNVGDLPGAVAVGCAFNAGGAPAPCTIASVLAGACSAVTVGGAAAVNDGLVCSTSSGAPTPPVAQAGQVTVHGS